MVGGRSQAALVEKRREPQRLERDGFPPVFGPLITSARRRAELELDRARGGRVEQRMAGAAQDDVAAVSTGAAPPAPGEQPAGEREVEPRDASTSVASAAVVLADAGARAPEDALDLVALGALRLAEPVRSSTTANGSTKRVWPDPELSWTIPGTAPARTRGGRARAARRAP